MKINPSSIALETIKIVKAGFYIYNKNKVKLSIKSQLGKIISPNSVNIEKFNKNLAGKISCVQADTFDASQSISKYNCLVLDFASDSEPGGGWKSNQTGTQEESLCRRSNLGLELEKINYPINESSFVLIPNIIVFRTNDKLDYQLLEKPFIVSVIAGSMRNQNNKIIKDKIKGLLSIAIANNYKYLVLGAWGCGAFGNEPENIAMEFKKQLIDEGYRYYFDEIIFAIPKKPFYYIFQTILC